MGWNINIRNRLGKAGSGGNKSSVAKRKSDIRNVQASEISKVGSTVSKGLGKISSGSSGSMISALGSKMGIVGAVVSSSIAVAGKSVDLYTNYQQSKSGQTIHYGNIRARKNMVLSLGTNLLYPAIKNELFTKNVVKRQNFENEYGKELYNLNNFGEKHKVR